MLDAKKIFGESSGKLDLMGLKGKLIAIEGTDGVGRTTQVELLQQWLEIHGYGVVTTGWTRSNLMSKSIELVKQGNMVDRRTFALLYATDFADRLENQVIPALKSGFVVLADRYVYTAWARDGVRSSDSQWIRNVLSFGIVPDLVIYLYIDIDNLVPRVIESGGMNYWESGMDMCLAENVYDSFRKYQTRLIKKYDEIAEEQSFEVVDARRSVTEIHETIKSKISLLLEKKIAS
jgi:dTMP kinase